MRPPMTPTTAGSAPDLETATDWASADSRLAGDGRPWARTLDSRATTALAVTIRSATTMGRSIWCAAPTLGCTGIRRGIARGLRQEYPVARRPGSHPADQRRRSALAPEARHHHPAGAAGGAAIGLQQPLRIGRQRVRGTPGDQEPEVAQAQAEPVGVSQPAGLDGGERAYGFQRPNGRQRAGRAHLRPRGAELELEELHSPLDVGQPARPELEVQTGVGAGRQPLGLDPGLDAAHGGDHPRGGPLGIDAAGGLRVEALAQLAAPGDRPQPDHRLALPRLRPAVPVGEVAVKTARQRSIAALR